MSNENLDTTTQVVPETATPNESAAAESSRPDFIQEKFWDADKNEPNLEALATSYNSLEKKLGSRTDELSKQVREDIEKEKAANTPEAYELNISELPENVTLDVSDDMPIVQWWKETAKSNGLSQEQFDQGVKMFVENAVGALPDANEEMNKLGDNARERVEAAELWSKKNLSPEAYSAFSSLAVTAEGVQAIEEIMKLNQSAVMPSNPTQIDVAPNVDDLRSMMNDPRYWDSARRDQSYVDRVSRLFEQAYASKNKKV